MTPTTPTTPTTSTMTTTPLTPTTPRRPSARLARTLAKHAAVVAVALPVLLPGAAYAEQPSPPSVPSTIKAPAGHVPYLVGHASGTQNYTCQPSSTSPSGYAWTLVAPDATLVDDKGKEIMTHFGGPTWQARDGSKVMGARVDGAPSPLGAIPWLLLRATSPTPGPQDGDRLTATTYIQRVNTTGGVASPDTCNAGTVGAATSVPYASDYYFYRAAHSD